MKKILLIVLLFSFFTVVNAETRVLDLNDKYIYELPGITIEANYNLDNTFHLTAKNVTDAYTCTGVLYAYEQKDVNSLIAKGPIYMDLSPNDNIRVLIFKLTEYISLFFCQGILKGLGVAVMGLQGLGEDVGAVQILAGAEIEVASAVVGIQHRFQILFVGHAYRPGRKTGIFICIIR